MVEREIMYLLKGNIRHNLHRYTKVYYEVTYEDDTIYIVFTSKYGITFTYVEYNIYTQIRDGIDGETIAYRAVRQFKKYINNQLFK